MLLSKAEHGAGEDSNLRPLDPLFKISQLVYRFEFSPLEPGIVGGSISGREDRFAEQRGQPCVGAADSTMLR